MAECRSVRCSLFCTESCNLSHCWINTIFTFSWWALCCHTAAPGLGENSVPVVPVEHRTACDMYWVPSNMLQSRSSLWWQQWLCLTPQLCEHHTDPCCFLSLIVTTIHTRTLNQGIAPKCLWDGCFYLYQSYLVWVALTIKIIDKMHEKSNHIYQFLSSLGISVGISS